MGTLSEGGIVEVAVAERAGFGRRNGRRGQNRGSERIEAEAA
jgi:hypothetical protein